MGGTRRLGSLQVIGSDVEDDGPGFLIQLYTQDAVTARILAGLLGKEVRIDVESAIEPQPEPEVLTLIEGKGRKRDR